MLEFLVCYLNELVSSCIQLNVLFGEKLLFFLMKLSK